MKYDPSVVSNTNVIRLIVDDRYRPLRHIVLLIGILGIISFSGEMSEYSGAYRYYRLICIYGAIVSMSYFNIYILVPKFFFKGSYILYMLLLSLLVIICVTIISRLLDIVYMGQPMIHRHHDVKGLYEGTIILIPIVLVTTMIKLFQRWTRDNERINELKNVTLTMELNELRNQINPHFLFNMLNGIKALVRSDPEKATMIIMKLSEFLRYQLYENNEEKTLLKSELDFLSNFLDLEKIRRDNLLVSVVCNTDHKILNSVFLPPNLFTTFVENAVKHSVNISQTGSYVAVKIDIEHNRLHFNCINSKDPDYKPLDKNSGLGLANIKRRLDLLYGDDYTLDIQSSDIKYEITLTIPL